MNVTRFLSPKGFSLLRLEEIPADLREIAIMSGYRPPRSTLKQCLLSAFAATNETLNIWTHFLPTLYFLWKLTEIWENLDVLSNPYTWAYAVYMMTICLYPLTSALAHTFYSMSDFARNVWFFLDYGALSFYSFGAGLLYRHYVFPEELLHSKFADIFLYVCAANTVLCTFMACVSRFVNNQILIKVLRLGAFSLPWVWDSVPLVYRLINPHTSESAMTLEHYFRHFVFSLLIGFFYATHLPERLAPGKFDIVGHSHQILHICGVLATNEQMNGALHDMEFRRVTVEHQTVGQAPSFWCVDVTVAVIVVNISIIALFSMASWKNFNGKNRIE